LAEGGAGGVVGVDELFEEAALLGFAGIGVVAGEGGGDFVEE